jgi:hypothetical protein
MRHDSTIAGALPRIGTQSQLLASSFFYGSSCMPWIATRAHRHESESRQPTVRGACGRRSPPHWSSRRPMAHREPTSTLPPLTSRVRSRGPACLCQHACQPQLWRRHRLYARDMLYDAFICHASEDKDDFVRPLARRLREQHVEVWYDEFSLNVGDSLRRSIDRGLNQSRFGIVVISPSFFVKQWSQWELDGFVARQNSSEQAVLLPVWHGVERAEVLAYSPSLADKVAVSSAAGLDEVVRQLVAVIHPQGSTLVIARDHLLNMGCTPPVISDNWWLDVAAASESNDMEGAFQEPMGWGRWGFPLPPQSTEPSERGWRLASAAMQMAWRREADERPITQITRPELVHEFIAGQPGLTETCRNHIRYMIAYAPQLTVRGFGGAYEDEIEVLYRQSVQRGERRRAAGSTVGTALTTNRRPPSCDDDYALRDPDFGCFQEVHIACGFVQGNHVASGPSVMYYSHIDYAAWMLSDESRWLPAEIRGVLTRGMAQWGDWRWYSHERQAIEDFGFVDAPYTGEFAKTLDRASARNSFRPTRDARRDAVHRLGFSAKLLQLPEDGETLADRLQSPDFLDSYFEGKVRQRR